MGEEMETRVQSAACLLHARWKPTGPSLFLSSRRVLSSSRTWARANQMKALDLWTRPRLLLSATSLTPAVDIGSFAARPCIARASVAVAVRHELAPRPRGARAR